MEVNRMSHMHEYLQRQRGTRGGGLVDNAGYDRSITGKMHKVNTPIISLTMGAENKHVLNRNVALADSKIRDASELER